MVMHTVDSSNLYLIWSGQGFKGWGWWTDILHRVVREVSEGDWPGGHWMEKHSKQKHHWGPISRGWNVPATFEGQQGSQEPVKWEAACGERGLRDKGGNGQSGILKWYWKRLQELGEGREVRSEGKSWITSRGWVECGYLKKKEVRKEGKKASSLDMSNNHEERWKAESRVCPLNLASQDVGSSPMCVPQHPQWQDGRVAQTSLWYAVMCVPAWRVLKKGESALLREGDFINDPAGTGDSGIQHSPSTGGECVSCSFPSWFS